MRPSLAWLPITLTCLAATALGAGCGSGAESDPSETTDADTDTDAVPFDGAEAGLAASYSVGDWSSFPDYMTCLQAVQSFYAQERFGKAVVPLAGSVKSNIGICWTPGACIEWVANLPDPAVWERIPAGDGRLPELYDLIIYAASSESRNAHFGHAASVDHVEVGADGKTHVFVMDANWLATNRKASMPHTVVRSGVEVPIYGWYRLRNRPWLNPVTPPPSVPPPSNTVSAPGCVAGGTYCGGDKAVGDPNTLYRCNGDGTATPVFACNHGCFVASGRNDVCRCSPNSYYCGGDQVVGNSSTLYRCDASGTAVSAYKSCANGCSVNPGANDTCR